MNLYIKTKEKKIKNPINFVQKLIDNKHSEIVDIENRIQGLKEKWKRLNESIAEKSQYIKAIQAIM